MKLVETRPIQEEVISNIQRIISSSLNIKDIYAAVVDELRRVMDFDRISISVPTEGNGMAVTFVAASTYNSHLLDEGKPYPLKGSLLERILHGGEAIIVEDTEKGTLSTDVQFYKEGIRSRLGYPLKVRGRVIGSINFSSVRPYNFSAEQYLLLEEICPQLALITENTFLFQEAKRSEEKYKDLYDKAPDMYCTYNEEGVILDCNETMVRMLGYPREALMGTSIYRYISIKDQKLLDNAIRAGQIEGLELQLARKDDGLMEVSLKATPKYDEGGRLVAFRAVLRDITHKKVAEELLRQEKEKLDYVMDVLGVGLCFVDRNMNILWANSNLPKVWGMEGLPPGTRCPDVFSCGEAHCPIARAFQEGKGRYSEIKVLAKGGVRCYVENTAIPFSDEKGEISRVLLLSRDVTLREKRLRQLALLRELGQALQETLNIERLLNLVLTCVTAGQAIAFNRAFLFLLDEEGEYICGKAAVGPISGDEAATVWPRLVQKYSTLEELLKRIMEQEPLDSPLAARTKQLVYSLDREEEIVVRCLKEMRTQIVRDAFTDPKVSRGFRDFLGSKEFACVPLVVKGKGIGVIVADNIYTKEPISEDHLHLLNIFAGQAALAVENAETYQRLEEKIEQLRETQERLCRSERLAAMGEISAYIAHEIRNPLVTIGGFARAIEKDSADREDVADAAQIIVEEVARLEKILANIKDFSKPPEPRKVRLLVNTLIEDTCSLTEGYIEEGDVKLVRDFSPELPFTYLDPGQIKQVLLNLIKNAVESMESGGTLTIRTLREGRYIRIDIADTGRGIAPEVMEKLFTPFFTTKTSGTGVGLVVCQKIIDDHDGKLRVSSSQGKGSTFSILLPIVENP